MLRQRFQAETDVEVEPVPADWEQYALWLENLAIHELNNELIKENKFLRNKIEQASKALVEGITGRYTSRRMK